MREIDARDENVCDRVLPARALLQPEESETGKLDATL